MQIDGIQNVYVVGDDIVESNAVSVFININGIAEVYVMSGFLFAAKIHQDFICYPLPKAFLMHRGD